MKKLFLIVVLVTALHRHLEARVYYASPQGGGDGRSPDSPFKVAEFWPLAQPGDTLILLAGRYVGSASMITPPEGLCGTAEKPIVVKAAIDGGPIIDGEWQRLPVKLTKNSFFVLEGFNAHSSAGSVVGLSHSSNNIVRRVCAWDANPNANCMVFECTYGSNNTFEDCAGWGSGRKIFGIYSDTLTVFRRCFFRWTYHTDAGGTWKVGMTLGYYSTQTLIENCIGTWDELPGANQIQRFAIFGTDNYGSGTCRILGSIGYILAEQSGMPSFVFATNNFIPGVEIRDCLAYTQKPNGTFSLDSQNGYVASRLTSVGGTGMYASGNQNDKVRFCIVQGGQGIDPGDRFDYVLFWGNSVNFRGPAPAHYSIRDPELTAQGGNLLQVQFTKDRTPTVEQYPVGARIEYKYENGVLTSEPLWPWPMNDRIREAMILSGYDRKGGLDGKGGLDLTRTVFELGGGSLPERFPQSGLLSVKIRTVHQSTESDWNLGFLAEVSGGQPPYRYFWRFGDGAFSVEPNPTHKYQQPGIYSVSVNVIDSFGSSASDTAFVQITPFSQQRNNTLLAFHATSPVRIDGRLDELDWSRAQFVLFSNPARSDNGVKVYALWDGAYVYFAYDVQDEQLETDAQYPWQNDGAEIYLDAGNEKSTSMDENDICIIATINGIVDPPSVQVNTVTNANGYTMEIAIPWRLLRLNSVPGAIGLLLANNDRDEGRSTQFDWLGLVDTGSYSRPSLWGQLSLVTADQQKLEDETPPSPPVGIRLIPAP